MAKIDETNIVATTDADVKSMVTGLRTTTKIEHSTAGIRLTNTITQEEPMELTGAEGVFDLIINTYTRSVLGGGSSEPEVPVVGPVQYLFVGNGSVELWTTEPMNYGSNISNSVTEYKQPTIYKRIVNIIPYKHETNNDAVRQWIIQTFDDGNYNTYLTLDFIRYDLVHSFKLNSLGARVSSFIRGNLLFITSQQQYDQFESAFTTTVGVVWLDYENGYGIRSLFHKEAHPNLHTLGEAESYGSWPNYDPYITNACMEVVNYDSYSFNLIKLVCGSDISGEDPVQTAVISITRISEPSEWNNYESSLFYEIPDKDIISLLPVAQHHEAMGICTTENFIYVVVSCSANTGLYSNMNISILVYDKSKMFYTDDDPYITTIDAKFNTAGQERLYSKRTNRVASSTEWGIEYNYDTLKFGDRIYLTDSGGKKVYVSFKYSANTYNDGIVYYSNVDQASSQLINANDAYSSVENPRTQSVSGSTLAIIVANQYNTDNGQPVISSLESNASQYPTDYAWVRGRANQTGIEQLAVGIRVEGMPPINPNVNEPYVIENVSEEGSSGGGGDSFELPPSHIVRHPLPNMTMDNGTIVTNGSTLELIEYTTYGKTYRLDFVNDAPDAQSNVLELVLEFPLQPDDYVSFQVEYIRSSGPNWNNAYIHDIGNTQSWGMFSSLNSGDSTEMYHVTGVNEKIYISGGYPSDTVKEATILIHVSTIPPV